MHDAIELERRGIPTVAIHTTVFMNSADAHARAYGMPDFVSVAIEHPVSGRPKEEIERKSDALLPQVMAILTGTAG